MKTRGSPPRYKTVGEMQTKIDAYFESLLAVERDEFGNVVTDSKGEPMKSFIRPPTITGLALSLGFSGRQSLLNYQAKPAFVDTVTRAKSICEEYAEGRLFDRDGVNGAKFSLSNNFRGWAEKQESTVNMTVEDDPITASLKEELNK